MQEAFVHCIILFYFILFVPKAKYLCIYSSKTTNKRHVESERMKKCIRSSMTGPMFTKRNATTEMKKRHDEAAKKKE